MIILATSWPREDWYISQHRCGYIPLSQWNSILEHGLRPTNLSSPPSSVQGFVDSDQISDEPILSFKPSSRLSVLIRRSATPSLFSLGSTDVASRGHKSHMESWIIMGNPGAPCIIGLCEKNTFPASCTKAHCLTSPWRLGWQPLERGMSVHIFIGKREQQSSDRETWNEAETPFVRFGLTSPCGILE